MAAPYSFDYKDMAAKIVAGLRDETAKPPADHQEARRRTESTPLRLELLAGCIAEDPLAVLSVTMAMLKKQQEEIASLQGGVQQLRAEVEEHVGRWVAAEASLETARQEITQKNRGLEALRAEVAASHDRQLSAELDANFYSNGMSAARDEVTRLQGELTKTREELERTKGDLAYYTGADDGYVSDWGGEGNWEGNDGLDI